MTFDQFVKVHTYNDEFDFSEALKMNKGNNYLVNNDNALSKALVDAMEQGIYFKWTSKTTEKNIKDAKKIITTFASDMSRYIKSKKIEEYYNGSLWVKNIELPKKDKLENITAVFRDVGKSEFIVTNKI